MNLSYSQIWDENPLQMIMIPTDRIIVIPELSGRAEYKRDSEKVKATANSIKEVGQIEPAIVGINTDEAIGEVGAPVLYAGFGRHEACASIGTDLLCSFSPLPVAERSKILTRGMHENIKRDDLSAVQVAMNIQRLRNDGLKDSEIAKRLGVSAGYVGNHARFLATEEDGTTPMFSKFALNAINKKTIPQRAAIELYDLGTSAAIDVAVKELIEEEKMGKKITSDVVRDKIRKTGPKKKKLKNGKVKELSKARRLPEVKALFDLLGGEGEDRKVRGFASTILGFIDGEGTTEAVAKRISKLLLAA